MSSSVQRETVSENSGVIQVMPVILANKIAAGEVVQRPASAVKELVENSIDAGAASVEIILRDAGRTLIQVVDDGCGMSASDARLCFERHATSKIRRIEDLERVLTLGFRGEALASIASVSRVELRTRRADDDVGTCIRLDGGITEESEPCAAPPGTSVSVRQLFYNVPARRAFLKTDATELRHVIDMIQALALANPGVGFRLVHDDNELVRVEGQDGDHAERLAVRIADLFGHDPARDLVAVDEATSYLRIHGFVARPAVRRRSRGEQFMFVNGRPVHSRYLDHAVRTAFGEMLPEGAWPFFALFLAIDTQHVDVNVHPTKAEVKFDDERGIYGMIRAVVGRALGEAEGIPRLQADLPDLLGGSSVQNGGKIDAPGTRPVTGSDWQYRDGVGFSGGASTGEGDPSAIDAGSLSELLFGPIHVRDGETDAPGLVASDATSGESGPTGPEPDGRFWQIRDRYIVAPIRSGLMIVDQHAAHERVLFERALHSLEDGFGLSQQLLFPQTVELATADHVLFDELLPDLRAIGFDLEPLSGRTVMIRGVPAEIRTGDERAVLEQVLGQMRALSGSGASRDRENLARALANRSAIPAGTRMDIREMRALIDQLFQCEHPYLAPDGKPTLLRIAADELDRRFGRRTGP